MALIEPGKKAAFQDNLPKFKKSKAKFAAVQAL